MLKFGVLAAFLLGFQTQITPVALKSETYQDLEPFGKLVGNSQVVQLGEATHGASEFFLLKTRLVKYLHEKKGINLLVMESGVLETGLTMLRRKQFTTKQLMESSVFGNFIWKESEPLFDYIKSNPKLKVVGMDPQFSSNEVLTLAADVVKPNDSELAADIAKQLGRGYGYMGKTAQPDEFRKLRDAYIIWLKDTLEKVKKVKADSAQKELLVRALEDLHRYWNYEPDAQFMQRIALRDEIMAANAIRQIGNQKAIVWAHNGHLGKGIGYKIVGDFLREKYGTKTHTVGIFGQSGTWYQHWTRTVQPWPPTTSFEAKAPTTGEAWFFGLKGMKDESICTEPENGGSIPFVPRERFDSAFVVTKLSAPTKPK